MSNETNIEYQTNLRTTADNSGVKEVKTQIKNIAEKPVVINTEVQSSDDGGGTEAARAAAEELDGICESAEEASQIRAEEASDRQQAARANK